MRRPLPRCREAARAVARCRPDDAAATAAGVATCRPEEDAAEEEDAADEEAGDATRLSDLVFGTDGWAAWLSRFFVCLFLLMQDITDFSK